MKLRPHPYLLRRQMFDISTRVLTSERTNATELCLLIHFLLQSLLIWMKPMDCFRTTCSLKSSLLRYDCIRHRGCGIDSLPVYEESLPESENDEEGCTNSRRHIGHGFVFVPLVWANVSIRQLRWKTWWHSEDAETATVSPCW